MSDSTIKVSIDLDPEELKHQVAAGIVKLGVEEALREGITNWSMTHWIENAVRSKVMQITGEIVGEIMAPLIEEALEKRITKEWLAATVEELIESRFPG